MTTTSEDLIYTLKITGEMLYNVPIFIIDMKLIERTFELSQTPVVISYKNGKRRTVSIHSKNSNKSVTYEFLYQYIRENKISRIETEVEFVIQNIQNNLYISFYKDSEELRQRIERNLNLVNSITIISGIGLIVVSLFVIIIEIQRLYTVVLFGTHKTNTDS